MPAAMPPALSTVLGTLTLTTSPGAKAVRGVPLVAAKLRVVPLTVAVPALRPPSCAEKTFRLAAEAAVTGSVKVSATAELGRGAVRAFAAGAVLTTCSKAVKPGLLPVPLAAVTVLVPVAVAPVGTTKLKPVAVLLVTLANGTGAPLTLKAVMPLRFVPVTATCAPAAALAGAKLVRIGEGSWFKRTLTVLLPSLAVSKSRSPSPSTSPTATLNG